MALKIRKLDPALLAILSLALILLGALCGLSQQEPKLGDGGALSMANPAAVNCEQNGGTYEDGECVFPGGSSCDAWSYLRGECNPQPEPGPTPVPGGDWMENLKSNCESNGGTVEGSNCVFSDGSSCDLEAFFLGECQPEPQPPCPGCNGGGVNPASVYCTEHGGQLKIEHTPEGDKGMCLFPDGSSCEEWAYMRGECQPKPQPVGAPGTERFTFRAVGAGQTDLVMKYVGPDGSVAKTKRWHIVVTG
jgi:putative hemolysin